MAIGGGSGGSSGAIRAGRAFVELFAEDSKLQRTLQGWKGRLLGFAGFVTKIGASMIGGGAAVLAPLVAIFASTVDHLDKLDEAATRLGTTPEIFDAMSKSASLAGIESEALEGAMSKMQATLSDAAHGGMETAEAFRILGLDAGKLLDLPLEEQLAAIADGLMNLENAADRTALARKIFGKSGASMLPMLAGGGAGVREGMAEFRDPALNEAAKNAGRFNDALDKLKMAVKSTVASVVFGFLDLVGPVETIASEMVKLAKSARQFIRENSQVIVGVAAVAAGLVIGGAAFITFGGILALVAMAVGGIGSALIAVKALVIGAATFIASPLGLITLAVVALAAGLAYLWSTTADGQSAIGQLKAGVGELAATFATAFQGIKDAFAAGDLSLAWAIALTAMKIGFVRAVSFLTERWNSFKGFFVDGWHDGIKLLKIAWVDFDEWFGSILLDTMKLLNTKFGETFRDLLRWLASLASALGDDRFAENLNKIAELGVGQLNNAIDGVKEEDKKKHRLQRNSIHLEAKDAQDARTASRKKDADFDLTIRRLEFELNHLADTAAEAAWQQALFDASMQEIKKGVAATNRLALFSGKGLGGFGGPLAAQFGLGGEAIDKQQLDELKGIREGIDQMPGKLGDELKMDG
jgi:hypothetical protein